MQSNVNLTWIASCIHSFPTRRVTMMIRTTLALRRAVVQSRAASYHTTASVWKESKSWADPAMRQYKFWNREDFSEKGKYSYLLEISPESIMQEAKILSLSDGVDSADKVLHEGSLPLGSKLLGVGSTLADFDGLRDSNPNVLFVSPSCPRAATTLPLVLAAFPSIRWVHCRSAGIDFVESDELAEVTEANDIQVTNAKGQFSSSLAEYSLMACSYL